MFSVRIKFPKSEFKGHINSITPDLKEDVGRSSTRIEEDADNFYIYIEAPDTVSLRASIGSLTRWLTIVDKIFEEVE
ncbi:hypothetical protein IX51_10740 [uncultured archaeon]|nr:hypothetical protein IX51_10740 [uncultured archaeon]